MKLKKLALAALCLVTTLVLMMGYENFQIHDNMMRFIGTFLVVLLLVFSFWLIVQSYSEQK